MSTDLTTSGDADVIRVNNQGIAQFTEQAQKLVTRMLCKDADPMEMAFFASYCKRLNLDPFSGHVHLVKRGSGNDKVARPELSIAGKLLIAERSGKYRGRTPYEWCGPEGVWTDVWLHAEHPTAARVGVYREGADEPIMAVALWSSYVGTKFGGEVNAMWRKHGPRMIAKCALSLALSEALPAELGGVYTIEEMAQIDNPTEAKRANAAQLVEGVELLDERMVELLTAISAAAGYEFDAADKLAEDFPQLLDAALKLATKEGVLNAEDAERISTAALGGATLDALRPILGGEAAA